MPRDRQGGLGDVLRAIADMVPQTLTRPWRILVHGNIQGPQLIPGPDARQQQQLRRLDGTGRNDDFAIHLDFPRPAPCRISAPTARPPLLIRRVANAPVTTVKLDRESFGLRKAVAVLSRRPSPTLMS